MSRKSEFVLLAVPISAIVAPSTFAVQYLTISQAQEVIFPGQKLTPANVMLTDRQRKTIAEMSGVPVRSSEQKIWRTAAGGWFILDEVIGKHEFIPYALGLNADGSVKQIEILEYRETYGDQIREPKWRSQFVGKKHGATLKLDQDIRNISGATLSSRHITDGVKRLLALYEVVPSEVRRARPFLGTFVEIAVNQLSESESHRAINAAFDVIEEVQRRMSFHDPASILSFLNRNAGHVPAPVDQWTFRVLKTAEEVHRISGGAFDVTVPLNPKTSGLVCLEKSSSNVSLEDRTSFSDVELHPNYHVRFRNRNLRLDLGGIAKGFAVDQAVTELKRCGAQNGLVNAGGDLRTFGETAFPVAIRHPKDPGSTLLRFDLKEGALATSADYRAAHFVSQSARRPIIDGRNARPVRHICSASVAASSAIIADALTKVVTVCGEDSLPVLNYFGAGAIFVTGEGKTLCSSDWHATFNLSA